MCFVLPETLHTDEQSASALEEENADRPRTSCAVLDSPADAHPETTTPKLPQTIHAAMAKALASLVASMAFLSGRANQHVALLLATLLTTTLGRHAQDILMQYARRRYDWSWSQAGFLVSLKSFVFMVLLLVLLPAVNYALGRWGGRIVATTRQRDLWLARVSCGILIFGAVTIGLAPRAVMMVTGAVVYCLGNGYNFILRSLLADVVEPAHHGTLFNTAGILESLGAVIAGPLLAVAFRAGIQLGEFWTGLPFFVAAILFSTAMAVLVTVRLPTE